MKREEEIKQVAQAKENELCSTYQAFVLGATWADSHPVYAQGQTDRMQATEVEFAKWWFANHKEQPTFADAIEWERKRMLAKACKWLQGNFYDTQDRDLHPEVICSSCNNVEELIEDYCKAMEE